MVGRVDDSLREDLEQVLIAAAGQGSATIAEVTIRLGDVPPDSDEQVLLESIEDFWADYMGQSLDEFDISGCLSGIIQVIRDHQIVLPSKISMLLKVLEMLEGTSRQLNPKFSLAERIEPYARIESANLRTSHIMPPEIIFRSSILLAHLQECQLAAATTNHSTIPARPRFAVK
ncbi:MAG: hypothetical protein IT422_06360 [Pirellulaceae bacterium]|jgi:ubiquinone biosynthesis protein|nr:hypothetical protein [Pirellulaceae bacterium]